MRHDDESVLRTGHRTAHEEQIPLDVGAYDL